MTELTLYGRRLSVPPDASFEMVPVPTTAIGWIGEHGNRYGWCDLYAWTVGIASEDDVREQVMRGAGA